MAHKCDYCSHETEYVLALFHEQDAAADAADAKIEALGGHGGPNTDTEEFKALRSEAASRSDERAELRACLEARPC